MKNNVRMSNNCHSRPDKIGINSSGSQFVIPAKAGIQFYYAIFIVLAGIMPLGCTGAGTVHVVPFMRSNFAPNESLVQTVRANEAYYFRDHEGKMIIALRYRLGSLLGRAFDAEWSMSMVLEDFPAGSEKLYKVNTQSVRIIRSYGPDHTRSRSLRGGIALIYAPNGNRLKGRFHIVVQRQRFGVLKGWSPETLLVTAGEFEAVKDPLKGRQILARTEADGFGRNRQTEPEIRWIPPTKASTRPATQPATQP